MSDVKATKKKETEKAQRAITWAVRDLRVGKAKNIRMKEPTTRRHRNGGIVGISNKCKNHSSSALPPVGNACYGVRMGVRTRARDATGCHGLDGALALSKAVRVSTGTYRGPVVPFR